MSFIQQGTFLGTGAPVNLNLRAGVTSIDVWNLTTIAAGLVNGTAVNFSWLQGMAAGDGIVTLYNAAGLVQSTNATLGTVGFTLFDTTGAQTLSANRAITRIGQVANRTLTANTAGLVAGQSIIRYNNVVGASQLGGLDFLVTAVNAGVSFDTANGPTIADTGVTTGNYRLITANPEPIYTPRRRVISAITAANPGVVTTMIPHGYTTGQQVRISIPPVPGLVSMSELNGVSVAVTVLTATTFSIIDTTGFTAFAFPTNALYPSTFPEVIPVGENIAQLNNLNDSVFNTGAIGITLGNGVSSPAGVLNNVIRWRAIAADL